MPISQDRICLHLTPARPCLTAAKSGSRSRGSTNAVLFLLLSCFCIIIKPYSSHAAEDSVTQGQQLTHWDSLISSSGFYELGFFSPGFSGKYFLGIWYTKSPYIKPVWVANRNSPISGYSGALTITGDGKLNITYNQVDSIVLNSNQTSTTGKVTATLLDSGNFVLTEEVSNSNGSAVLWQSFEYPTDTLLPGLKLGLNFKTGHTWSLTSSLSESVPAPGAFTLGVDPNGTKQLVIWQRGEVIWTSGAWRNGNFSKSIVPGFTFKFSGRYNFSFVSNEDEEYFTFSVNKNYIYKSNTSIIMWAMNPWGQMIDQELDGGRNVEWGKDPETIGPCEGHTDAYYSYNRVCVAHKRSECSSNTNEEFKRAHGFLDGIASIDSNLGISDCDAKCRSNCSCIAYSSFYDNGTGCVLWYKERGFTRSSTIGWDAYALTALLEDKGNGSPSLCRGHRQDIKPNKQAMLLFFEDASISNSEFGSIMRKLHMELLG